MGGGSWARARMFLTWASVDPMMSATSDALSNADEALFVGLRAFSACWRSLRAAPTCSGSDFSTVAS